jgi:hypothetical protein
MSSSENTLRSRPHVTLASFFSHSSSSFLNRSFSFSSTSFWIPLLFFHLCLSFQPCLLVLFGHVLIALFLSFYPDACRAPMRCARTTLSKRQRCCGIFGYGGSRGWLEISRSQLNAVLIQPSCVAARKTRKWHSIG